MWCVIGGKNSAAETALDFFRAGARVTIVHRDAKRSKSIKFWVRPDIDNRIRPEKSTRCFKAM